MISQNLAKHPDKAFNLTIHSQAKMLLLEIGILDQFLDNAPPPEWNGQWITSIGYADHPTHWIVGFQYLGFATPNENGYGAICIPKTECTTAELEARLRGELALNSKGPIFEKIVPLTKSQN